MITVQLSFTLVVPTNCEPVVSKLVECIANIVTSSNLTAALKNLIDLASTLQASSSLSANLQLTKFAASSFNTASSLAASALVSKLAASSLTGAGTLVADLTVTGSATLLLDLYPNAAAAYSLRKLRTAYTGSAIQVRRSSDNNVQDIGFTALGVLDESALTTFCGVGNGFVTTWYDQSGNNLNLIQNSAVAQPAIVNSGTLITQNLKPSIYFDGLNDTLTGIALSNYITTSTFSNICVFNPIALTTNAAAMESNDVLWIDGTSGYASLNFKSTGNLFASVWDGNIRQSSVSITANTQITTFVRLVSGNISISKNNGTFASAATGNIQNISSNLSIARSSVFSEIKAQEIIFYKTNQTDSANGINTNVNNYYAIY
jgi:hypothetical protein